jgi:hypothetical protein
MKKNTGLPAPVKGLLAALVLPALSAHAKEVEGEIMFAEGVIYINGPGEEYLLDTDKDGIEDTTMSMTYGVNGTSDTINRLKRYLQPGVKIIYEDKDMKSNRGFGAGRIIGFIRENGQFVRLDQMFDDATIKEYFPRLWEKMVAERRSRSR